MDLGIAPGTNQSLQPRSPSEAPEYGVYNYKELCIAVYRYIYIELYKYMYMYVYIYTCISVYTFSDTHVMFLIIYLASSYMFYTVSYIRRLSYSYYRCHS